MDVLVLFSKGVWGILSFTTLVLFRLLRTLGRGLRHALRPTSKTFGSARWARFYEAVWGGVWGGKGIIVGKAWGRFLRFNDEGYVLLFAPTRSGKGVGVVVPNLLTYQGSVICTDPKGENSAVTARWRRRLGPVVTLDVINPERSDQLNPLDLIRLDTYHEADDAMELAKLLIIPDSDNGGHWDNRAAQLLQILILYTCRRYADTPELRNLAKVRSLVALGVNALPTIIEEAVNLGSASLREAATAFRSGADSEEVKSVVANADKAISLWAADRPAGLVSMTSTFDFRDFNRQRMTCFVMVDEEKLAIYGGFLRVMMGCALMAMTRSKAEAQPAVPTLLLLDEAAAMGRIEPLETGVGYLATYARLLLVFQDLDQLQRTYPKARSMIANATCRVAFGVNDVVTAKMLADTIGQTTTASRSDGQSQRSADLMEHQRNHGLSETGRYLLDPSEIIRLGRNRALVFFNGRVRYPVLARKVRYYRILRWKLRWDRWRPGRPAKVVPLHRPTLPTDLAA